MLSFFGAYCVCFGEKVLSLEQKIFLCFQKRWKQRCFRRLTKRWAFSINSQPFELERIFQIKQNWSTIFFVLCNPVLYGWIFLYLDFTQRMTGIYSAIFPKQRTNRERQILSESVCFEKKCGKFFVYKSRRSFMPICFVND